MAAAEGVLIPTTLRIAAALIFALLAAALLYRRWRIERRKRDEAPRRLYGQLRGLLDDCSTVPAGGVGYPILQGTYEGLPIQLRPVVDTLALRRLPALWLLVTVSVPLPVAAKLDVMARPAGATTFSNFDLLPHTLDSPAGFPDHTVLRTDDRTRAPPAAWLSGHGSFFEDPRAKELLVAPQGVRLVWLLAEADRARYGVLREAEFGPVEIDPAMLRGLLERLVSLRRSILSRAGVVQ